MTEPEQTAVRARIASVRYPGTGRSALCNIDIEVRKGEFVVVAGRAGSGKTTLCRCLSGVIPKVLQAHVDGWVRIMGTDIASLPLPRVAPLVGLVTQTPESQLFSLTVREDVAFGPENLCLDPDEVLRRVRNALTMTGAMHLAGRFSHTLSGGESQRVVIASVLAVGPEVLIFDHPAAELDPAGREAVYQNIYRLNRAGGKTVVVVEDRLGDVLPYADRILLMDEGRLILDCDPESFVEEVQPDRYPLRLPAATALAHLLRRQGLPFPRAPITAQDFVRQFRDLVPVSAPNPQAQDSVGHEHPPERSHSRGEVVIRVHDLHHRYPGGVHALKGVDLEVAQGELVAILGQNGAGKSTLVKHFIGLLRPSRGKVSVLGMDVARTPVHKLARYVGYLFQDPDLSIFNNTCREELIYGIKLTGTADGRADDLIHEVLDMVGLSDDILGYHPYVLSRGQRQRLALASVLAVSPPILILDEPTTGLDLAECTSVMRALQDYCSRGGTAVMVTHDLDIALNYATRVVVMSEGQVTTDLPASQVGTAVRTLEESGISLPDLVRIASALGIFLHKYSLEELAQKLKGIADEYLAVRG